MVVEGAVSSEILVVWVGGLERFQLIGLPITKGGGDIGGGKEERVTIARQEPVRRRKGTR